MDKEAYFCRMGKSSRIHGEGKRYRVLDLRNFLSYKRVGSSPQVRLMPQYPHMSPHESAIWRRFMEVTKLKFIRFEYDVHVGVGYVPEYLLRELEEKEKLYEQGKITFHELELTRNIVKSSKMLTQLRIDVVGETEHEVWVFEVKPRAGRSALGQVESYAYWYLRQYKPAKAIRPAVVCEDIDPNMPDVFSARGVSVFVVSRV